MSVKVLIYQGHLEVKQVELGQLDWTVIVILKTLYLLSKMRPHLRGSSICLG